jgi:DNA-directed RNA polymerase subunit F
MPTSVYVRRLIADLAGKRADIEKKIGEAEARRAKKESEAAARQSSAARTSSDSARKSYLRQAEAARESALRESKTIATLSQRRAAVSRDEEIQQRALVSAQRSEANKARQEQEREERQRKADERRRQQERMEDSRRRREDQALMGAMEQRLAAQIAEIRPPRREQLRILYATVAPRGDLRVDEEIRRVKAAVRISTNRDQVDICHLPAATAGDLLDGLTSFRPHVVHFSGHADESSLVFGNGRIVRGAGHVITARAFKSAVEAPDEPPLLVVLNACRSAAHLKGLLGRVPLAVGMSENVGDVDAIVFATRFYRTLAEGQSVSAAVATARAEMEMNGLPHCDLPTLEVLDGLDPTLIRLVVAD